jgi:hypothetical protein
MVGDTVTVSPAAKFVPDTVIVCAEEPATKDEIERPEIVGMVLAVIVVDGETGWLPQAEATAMAAIASEPRRRDIM